MSDTNTPVPPSPQQPGQPWSQQPIEPVPPLPPSAPADEAPYPSYPSYQPPAAGPQQPYPAAEPSTNTFAIVSLVASFVVSIVGIIFGHIALSQIRRTGEKGRGLAIAGLAIGYARLALTIAAVIVVAVILVVSLSSHPRHSTDGNPFAVPAPEAPPASEADDITFDSGSSIPATAIVHLSDGLLGNTQWKPALARTDGTWTYVRTDGSCRTTFHEGALDPAVDVTPGDDAATTASYLAVIDKLVADDVSANASDDYVGLGVPESTTIVSTRAIEGTDAQNGTFLTSARAFADAQQGFFIDVTCKPGTDVEDVYTQVVSASAILIG